MKIYKILGKSGRITIPLETRINMGFGVNDVISFEEQDDNTVVIRKEKVCAKCDSSDVCPIDKPNDETTLLEFLNGLSPAEKRAALVHLSMQMVLDRKEDETQ